MLISQNVFLQVNNKFFKKQNKFYHILLNFHGFQGWDLAFSGSQQKSLIFQGFKDFFKGSKKKRTNQGCFKGFKEFKGCRTLWNATNVYFTKKKLAISMQNLAVSAVRDSQYCNSMYKVELKFVQLT